MYHLLYLQTLLALHYELDIKKFIFSFCNKSLGASVVNEVPKDAACNTYYLKLYHEDFTSWHV